MSQNDVDKYNIKACGCGESEFLQVLPVYNRHKVHCVNCGNRGQAMLTEAEAAKEWNESGRFDGTPIVEEIPGD